jgi:hypothetical protein
VWRLVPPDDLLHVATERLGWPPGRKRWRRWFGELQTRMVYDDRPNEPTATCHLQRHEDENALCGYHWEGLVLVPGSPTWTDLHPNLRCSDCSRGAGVPKEDPEGLQYRHDWGKGR